MTLKAQNRSEIGAGTWDGFLAFGLDISELERTVEVASGVNVNFHPEGTDFRVGLYAQGEFVPGDRLTIIRDCGRISSSANRDRWFRARWRPTTLPSRIRSPSRMI